jgi:hypothetical protein
MIMIIRVIGSSQLDDHHDRIHEPEFKFKFKFYSGKARRPGPARGLLGESLARSRQFRPGVNLSKTLALAPAPARGTRAARATGAPGNQAAGARRTAGPGPALGPGPAWHWHRDSGWRPGRAAGPAGPTPCRTATGRLALGDRPGLIVTGTPTGVRGPGRRRSRT